MGIQEDGKQEQIVVGVQTTMDGGIKGATTDGDDKILRQIIKVIIKIKMNIVPGQIILSG